MSALILDCSITLAWCFDDEATESSWALLDRVAADGALVPPIWPYEVGNVLAMAERRGRLSAAVLASFLDRLGELAIEIDEHGHERALHEVLQLARTERLTTYDTAYLELAMRRGLPLATRDQGLAEAAGRAGVALLPA